MILPAYLMSIYANSMFQKSISAEIPIRRPASKKKPPKRLPESVLKGSDCVSKDDVASILNQVRLIQRHNTPFWKSLCYFRSLCKQDKQIRLMERVAQRFEEQLDVRSFVRVRTNLALLQRVFFSDQQLMLFRHQRRRSISVAMKYEKSSSSMDESSDELGKSQPYKNQMKEFQKLVGFQAKSKLDRVLIEGIFGANLNKKYRDY